MFKKYLLLKKITEIIFGNTIVNTPKQKTRMKRVIGFETLENRDYLSVSPLLPGIFSSSQLPFEQNVSAYVDEYLNVGTNHTIDSTENGTDMTMSFQTESDETMDCCSNNTGTITATTETTNLGERTTTNLSSQGVVHIERSNDDDCGIEFDVTVTYRLSGTATLGSDYSAGSSLSYHEDENCNSYYEGTLVIQAYTCCYNYSINVLNDCIDESSETIVFTLVSAEAKYYYEVDGSVEFTIQDDDDWTVTGNGGDSIWEHATVVDLPFGEFEITRSGGPDRTYGITTEFVLSGSATPITDYHLSWTNANDYETVISIYQDNDDVWKGSVYFPANTTDDTITIYVIPNNDALPENNETVTITITNAYANPLYPFNASGSGTFTIQDDDNWTVTLSGGGNLEEVPEDDGVSSQSMTVTRTGGQDKSYPIYVALNIVGTATLGSDYQLYSVDTYTGQQTLLNSTTITIPTGKTSVELAIEVIDDEYVEKLYESYSITIASATYGSVQYSTSGSASGTIKDNDKLILEMVSFSNNLNLISDTEGSFGTSWKNGPHWISDYQNQTLPVAYSSGNDNNILSCVASISGQVDPVGNDFVEVRFTWSGGGTSEWVTFGGDGNYAAELSETFAELFGQQQAYYEADSTLTWEFRVEEEDRGTFGESVNPIYVTYNNPVAGTTLYHTVVHTGCAAANGVGGTEQMVFDAVWNKFQSLEIKKINLVNGEVVEGETLTYYGKDVEVTTTTDEIEQNLSVAQGLAGGYIYDQFASRAREFARNGLTLTFTTVGLLQKTDATCGAWQDFAVNVFGVQGISISKKEVYASSTDVFRVDPLLSGQGGGTPRENTWGDHALISYNGNIYDPSYGVNYGTGNSAKQAFINNLSSIGDIEISPPLIAILGRNIVYVPSKFGTLIAISDLTFGW